MALVPALAERPAVGALGFRETSIPSSEAL
jgi:hypothetical protein